MKLRFCKWDILPIAAMAVLAAAVFFLFLPAKTSAHVAEIYKDGVLLTRLPLSQDATFCVEGAYKNVITVREGRVAVTESDCPGGDCKACSWRASAGSIVCLPNGMEVRITGASDVDIIVR